MPRSFARRTLAASLALALGLVAPAPTGSVARAEDRRAPDQKHFYQGYDYGSQSLYGPIYVLLNRGFDVLQMRGDRRLLSIDYTRDGGNVLDNLTHPFRAIEGTGGTWRFVRQEVLPLSFTPKTARWVPNYTLHLLGGGQTYAALREWFMAHEAPPAAATVFSIATVFTSAFVNESIENKGYVGFNTDCIADILIFDVAGVALFSFEGVRRFFSQNVVIADWSLQPAIALTSGNLHNQGNYYAAKIAVPFHPRLRLFGYGGMATMGGLSYLVGNGYSISAGAGGKFAFDRGVGPAASVATKLTGAVFLDRNNSLLASIDVSDVQDYFASVNVYPNAFVHTDPGFGFWGVMGKDGRFVTGVSFTRAFGLGIGAGTMK